MASTGKRVGERLYVGLQQTPQLDEHLMALVNSARDLLDQHSTEPFNVLRIDAGRKDVAFLHYPELGHSPFPTLSRSCRVNVTNRLVTHRLYDNSLNPPILHRTELLLPQDHPIRSRCEALTATCESLGLFDHPTVIGFKQQWQALIAERGFSLNGFDLVPIGNVEPDAAAAAPGCAATAVIERHLTALARTSLSAPVHSLIRDQLLTTTTSFFDYGCGRGNDLATLLAVGYRADGWDPHYRPDSPRSRADVVNLGFVINVIEDLHERIAALEGAYALANGVLAVSAMLASHQLSKGRQFGDGVLTSRNTFQKYYSQGELRAFIENVLEEDAYPAAPGIFYVFHDRDLEQCYLLAKSSNRSRVERLLARALPPKRRPSVPLATEDRTEFDSVEARDELTKLWRLTLELGRIPSVEEIPSATSLKRIFGSVKRAINECLADNDAEALRRAELGRREDILVMYALRTFDRRRRFGKLEPRLARDIRTFFGTVATAEAHATKILFSIQDSLSIKAACEEAATSGLGWLEAEESLQLHTSLVARLPALLRVYIECASLMAGDLTEFDLVKAHIQSGKVSLMSYDDFTGQPIPLLRRRVKVRLRDQELDVFDYDEHHPPSALFRKSRYINEEFSHFAQQVAFEEELEALREFNLDDHGPPGPVFRAQLSARRYCVQGFRLVRSEEVPDLDVPCGRHYRFRDLVECGETWTANRPPNAPARAETYNALSDLAAEILDPVIDYFGAIELTYGFAASSLTRLIQGRIAPHLDQHASCELNRAGSPVCKRSGAAVDILVRDENMNEVAAWIARNCRFDRIYIYGTDRPLHVSIGPDNAREIYQMVDRGVRRIPRRIRLDELVG